MANLAELKPYYLLEQPEYPNLPKCKNGSVRPISREVDLAWLAGIIDGEGNLQATVQYKWCGPIKRPYFEPKVRITNTDVRMVKKISEIYVSEDIVFFYSINAVSRYKNKKDTWRDQLEISVGSKKQIRKLLPLVIPYMVNKRRYAELMLSALEWLDSQPARGKNSKGENYAVHPQFVSFIRLMEEERKSLIAPSTTTRRAREVLSW